MYIGYTADIFKAGFPCRSFFSVGVLWYTLHSDVDAAAIKAAGFWIEKEKS